MWMWLEMMHVCAIDYTATLSDLIGKNFLLYGQIFLEVKENMYWKILS